MVAVWARARGELLRRWVSWLGVVAVVGLLGGAALGGLIGARRTATSFERFAAWSRGDEWRVVYIGSGNPGPDLSKLYIRLAGLSGVAEAARYQIVALAPVAPKPGQDRLGVAGLASDDGLFTRLDRAKVLSGRRPRADQPDEVAVTPDAAHTLRVGVGSTLRVRAVARGQVDRLIDGFLEPVPPPGALAVPGTAVGPVITLRVVGIEIAPGDREFTLGGPGNFHLSPAFLTRWPDLVSRPALAIRVSSSAGVYTAGALPAASTKVRNALQRDVRSTNPVEIIGEVTGAARTVRSTHLLATGLTAFGVLIVLVAMVAVGETVIRQAEHEKDNHQVLRALGMTQRQLLCSVVVEATVAAALGALLAAVIAAATSWLTPIGLARQIEPAPGFALNLAWLAGGFVAIVVISAGVAALAAWASLGSQKPSRARSPRRSTLRPSNGQVDVLAPGGVPTTVVVGVRLAVGRSSGRRVSVGAAVLGSVLAVGGMAAAFSFDAGLTQLLHTPRLYGWNWDAYVGNAFRGLTPGQTAQIDSVMRRDPAIGGYSRGVFASLSANPLLARLPVEALDTTGGSVIPPLVEGRPVVGSNEIVVGASDLVTYHVHVGGSIDLSLVGSTAFGRRNHRFRIVGTAVFAHLVGNQSSGPLDHGSWMTLAGLRSFYASPEQLPAVNEFLVRFARGVSSSAEMDHLRGEFEAPPFDLGVRPADAPTDVNNVGRVDQLPPVLAALLATAAVALLAHALVVTVWRRRREYAVLRTLGFIRRQLYVAVIGQATTLVVLGLALGLPLGVVAGQWAWHTFASQVGIVPTPTPVPWLALLLLIPSMIVLAAVVAIVPARFALGVVPAAALRAE